jgi:hypothetical protein
VLAGGSGERLRSVTERWLGEHRPKQYCTFVGTRSMMPHTLDRVKTVVPPRQPLPSRPTTAGSKPLRRLPGRRSHRCVPSSG